MRRKRHTPRRDRALVAALLAGAKQRGSSHAGTIVGSVKDQQARPSRAPTITITEVSKGTVSTDTTAPDGSFVRLLSSPVPTRWRWSRRASGVTSDRGSAFR